MSDTLGFTGSIEIFEAPETGAYQITAAGAQGGAANFGAAGGNGAEVIGDFNLIAGELIEIVIGGQGVSGDFGGGGGGGTYVALVQGPTLLIAGGGGGGGAKGSGGGGTPQPDGSPSVAAPNGGGVNGGGGSGGPALGGGGGGGLDTAGTAAVFGGGGGARVGIDATTHDTAGGGTGGFGGGGNAGYGGGGGGGYSGGGGGALEYGGGGGGSLDSGSRALLESGVNAGDGFVTFQQICYLRGTLIATPSGDVPIELLSICSGVSTKFGDVQPVRWIGRQSYDRRFLSRNPALMPVRIHAGALGDGLPRRDLFVSPGHAMLIGDRLVLARTLVNGVTVTQDDAPDEVHYYQLVLDRHDCVLAEGVWSETFADGEGLRARFHNIAEFDALYPEWAEPAERTLCAPRPSRGPDLDRALRPIVARAAAGLRPGLLSGYVDQIGSSGAITGWARDRTHRRLPVLLDIVSGDETIGTVLACDERHDLTGAGLGPCAFHFACPTGVTPAMAAKLWVRRAGDGAELARAGAERRNGGSGRSATAV